MGSYAESWPYKKSGLENEISITGVDEVGNFYEDHLKTLVITDGWISGSHAAVLRGGNNAIAVLEVLASAGVRDIVIYHLEEKIPQLEEIFLTTVVSEANRLFDRVKILWRHYNSIYDLVAKEGAPYQMLFFGAPLTKSEIQPFYQLIKENYQGKVAIIRGPLTDIEFTAGDEIFNWVRKRTFEAADFSLPAVLRKYKKQLGIKTGVVLPTLNEEKTIARVIETVLEVKNIGVIDEVILVDSASTDNTVSIAREYRIPIFQHHEIAPELGGYHGKGEAMFKSGLITDSDIIAWVDTDIENITPTFFYGLFGPMLTNPEVKFVKGYFARPIRVEASGVELGGGRVTEILVRPWLNTFLPQLSGYIQPLAGTVAIQRDLFQKMRIPTNFGVEIAMLIQAVKYVGLWATSQVNLGEVIHKSKDVNGLGEMAFQILQVLTDLTENVPKTGKRSDPIIRHVFSSQGSFEISTKRFTTYWREFPSPDLGLSISIR